MQPVQITDENFEAMVVKSEKPVLLDFYANWCYPCKMMSPLVEQAALEHPEFLVGKVDVDASPVLAMQFRIASIPMLCICKNGVPVKKSVGAISQAELEAFLQN